MMQCGKQVKKINLNDTVYTPPEVAKSIIDMCDILPHHTVLDPCLGGGVFYNQLPECQKEYCEIDQGLDFFKCEKRFDLIVGNPPYSLWNEWIEHTMKLTDKFCYIFGCFNFTDKRIRDVMDKGYGITKFHLLKIDWWYSPSFVVLFEKNKPSIITVSPKTHMCEVCHKRCKRGRCKNSPNECTAAKDKEAESKADSKPKSKAESKPKTKAKKAAN